MSEEDPENERDKRDRERAQRKGSLLAVRARRAERARADDAATFPRRGKAEDGELPNRRDRVDAERIRNSDRNLRRLVHVQPRSDFCVGREGLVVERKGIKEEMGG